MSHGEFKSRTGIRAVLQRTLMFRGQVEKKWRIREVVMGPAEN